MRTIERDPGETLDAIFDGRIKIWQRRQGYRFSLDSLLLADFARIKPRETVADLGAGNGVISLILAERCPQAHFFAVEVQLGLVARAQKNVRLNRLQERIDVAHGDLRAIERIARTESFDVGVTNPPFRKSTSGRISSGDEKRIARHEIEGSLLDFLRAGAYLLRAKGRLNLVYPAVRAVDLMAALRALGLEPKRVRLVHSFANSEATLILAEGVKGGRGGVEIVAPLIVYKRVGEYTDEAAAIIAGSRSR